MKVEFDLNKIVRSNVAKLKAYSSARDEFEEATANMVFLDANENPFQNGVNRYPDPKQQSVKQLLSKIKDVPTNQILLGNGSDEVLDLIFRAFCEPKQDNVVLLPPTYGMYGVLAGLNDVTTKEVLLSDKFDIRVQETLDIVDDNSKLLFLCSPNNPSGNSFSSVKIERIIKSFNGIVVVDEAYIDFSSDESWSKRLNDFPNLIVTQTLSKAYGMAGIRLGICYASPEIIEILNRIKPPYNVNELTQQKAKERLMKFDEVQTEIRSILAERIRLEKQLEAISFITKIFTSDANFLLVKVDNANERYNELIAKGIVIRNRTTQPLCENTLRLTIGTRTENNKLIEALKELDND
ncbi:histidinol-phosphate transaminase [Urechidicola vernalis]|uniref:Histidinol-phosphate aminotransferase n=1 Tax=Urechidicola vernalis TaxID=3075600 RepID=A0ABU2Y3U3_9FLAO|nr:histidinol-phosphate transaminase [Urechidicola sp. P050]MDT0552873.1 histidinol-phosphate transaminase [Urechidicola sp. P050]